MLIKRKLRVFLALISVMSLSVVSAAELRGQLSYDAQQLNGPVVTVFCSGIQTGYCWRSRISPGPHKIRGINGRHSTDRCAF